MKKGHKKGTNFRKNKMPGAIYGTLITIDRPTEDAQLYLNRKIYFSTHLQCVMTTGGFVIICQLSDFCP